MYIRELGDQTTDEGDVTLPHPQRTQHRTFEVFSRPDRSAAKRFHGDHIIGGRQDCALLQDGPDRPLDVLGPSTEE